MSIVLENESLPSENTHILEVLKKKLTDNKDNLASAYADLEMDGNAQKLVDAVYERANTGMGKYWSSFMEMSDIIHKILRLTPVFLANSALLEKFNF